MPPFFDISLASSLLRLVTGFKFSIPLLAIFHHLLF
nr:MAG TPA: hypothetical protein [Caudoviricetes sp.]